jgi:hypothetical protein
MKKVRINNMERLTRYNQKQKQYTRLASRLAVDNKLGKLEDLLENADSIKIIKRNGVASLHIDMILDNETLNIAEELFGKEKVIDYEK